MARKSLKNKKIAFVLGRISWIAQIFILINCWNAFNSGSFLGVLAGIFGSLFILLIQSYEVILEWEKKKITNGCFQIQNLKMVK